MSMYCLVKTQFKSPEALVAALMETKGWTREQIEVHQEAQTLFGYHNDARQQKAHIIIRRQNVGGSSNDVGFERVEDGTFRAHISQFDRNHHKYNDEWIKRVTQNYAYHAVRLPQEAEGRTVSRERRMVNGRERQFLEVTGYR